MNITISLTESALTSGNVSTHDAAASLQNYIRFCTTALERLFPGATVEHAETSQQMLQCDDWTDAEEEEAAEACNEIFVTGMFWE